MIESFLRERQSDLEFMLHSYTFEALSRPEKLLDVFEDLQKNLMPLSILGFLMKTAFMWLTTGLTN
jgi:hypothetical protein